MEAQQACVLGVSSDPNGRSSPRVRGQSVQGPPPHGVLGMEWPQAWKTWLRRGGVIDTPAGTWKGCDVPAYRHFSPCTLGQGKRLPCTTCSSLRRIHRKGFLPASLRDRPLLVFFPGEPSEGPSTLSFLRLRPGATGLSHPALLRDLASAARLHGGRPKRPRGASALAASHRDSGLW